MVTVQEAQQQVQQAQQRVAQAQQQLETPQAIRQLSLQQRQQLQTQISSASQQIQERQQQVQQFQQLQELEAGRVDPIQEFQASREAIQQVVNAGGLGLRDLSSVDRRLAEQILLSQDPSSRRDLQQGVTESIQSFESRQQALAQGISPSVEGGAFVINTPEGPRLVTGSGGDITLSGEFSPTELELQQSLPRGLTQFSSQQLQELTPTELELQQSLPSQLAFLPQTPAPQVPQQLFFTPAGAGQDIQLQAPSNQLDLRTK